MSNAKLDRLCIDTIRFLAAEGVQKAKSGHPGMPIGMAPAAYTLWTKVMRHKVGFGDLVCSACPEQPQRCGDGEDRDLLQQSVAAHTDDVADGTHRRKHHRALSVRRKTCVDASLTWR